MVRPGMWYGDGAGGAVPIPRASSRTLHRSGGDTHEVPPYYGYMGTNLEDLKPGDTCVAWDIIGFDGAFRVAGGRVDWEAADYDDSRGGRLVRITRLVVDAHGLSVRTRYVDPDTQVTIVQGCI